MLHSKRFIAALFVFTLMIGSGYFFTTVSSAFAVTSEQFQVSPGVKYKENQEVINTRNQSIKVMEVNLMDPYTKLDLSVPSPLNSLSSTSAQAKADHREGNRVVGAVNGSFFDMSTRVPMYLISYNNILLNAGIIASGRDQYVNEPIAFGVNSSGKAIIDQFHLNMSVTHAGTPYEITSMNKIRNYDDLILYTPDHGNGYTNTNPYGMEVVFTGASKNKDLAFGDKITATVSQIRSYNDPINTKIPEDGFVLSAHGESLSVLKSMMIGDEVEVSIDIDEQWKNSKYMLASGPRLVHNGAVSLSIDPNSSRATERAPRTAIAVDRTLTKVFLVTVDGRQPGYSSGMNMTEFAQYLVKLGAYRALNLDGGGSTTMVARRHGNEYAGLMNRPSDGWERPVSTTLQAISTAPKGQPSSFSVALSSYEVEVGSTITVSLKNVLDQYYNPLAKDATQLKLSSTLGTFEGSTLKTSKVGSGIITATYGNLTKEIAVTVKDVPPAPSAFTDIPSTHKYYPEINYLSSEGIIKGFADGTYRPALTLKRIDAALLLVRSLKLDTTNVKDVQFTDIPKEYRFYKEIAAIAGAGIMSGKAGNLFDPNAPLTRAEMAVILQRGFKLSGTAEVQFKDVPQSSFAYEAISALVANKVTEGYYDNTFRPGDSVTRIQYALFLYRILK